MPVVPQPDPIPAPTDPRRHDLDALRAFAMLLGIALHGSMSFFTIPWLVQDTRQNELFGLFFVAVHGFRMPLFFLVSGFFTAMLWRKRGPLALLKQRAVRILVPCLVGLLTVVPAIVLVAGWAMRTAPIQTEQDDGTLVAAVKAGKLDLVRSRLEGAGDLSARDPVGVTPLSWATLHGETEIARLLLDHGASPDCTNIDGSTPLHSAAFLGQAEVAGLLVERGADLSKPNQRGELPLAGTAVPWETTEVLSAILKLPALSKEDVELGRQEVRTLFEEQMKSQGAATVSRESTGEAPLSLRAAYAKLMDSPALNVPVGDSSIHLFSTPIFAHLWFLWFLCWLVPLFLVVAWVAERVGLPALPRGLVVSPARYLWLIPLTLVPQLLMGISSPSFGPDTSEGLIPLPHVLLYYAIFFGFGALDYLAGDDQRRIGRWWWLPLSVGFFVLLPAGLATMGQLWVGSVVQVTYTWLMCFGLLGLFRRFVPGENRTIRYLSDSSYWLYLVHLPLIVAAQAIVRSWPLPSIVKFGLICTAVTAILLITYETMVRYTWIGYVLNGPRTRRARPDVTVRQGLPQLAPEGE